MEQVLKDMGTKANTDLSSIPIIIADIQDVSSIKAMTSKAKIIVNCCGPYRFYGETMVIFHPIIINIILLILYKNSRLNHALKPKLTMWMFLENLNIWSECNWNTTKQLVSRASTLFQHVALTLFLLIWELFSCKKNLRNSKVHCL